MNWPTISRRLQNRPRSAASLAQAMGVQTAGLVHSLNALRRKRLVEQLPDGLWIKV